MASSSSSSSSSHNLLITLLDGSTRCLQLPSATVSVPSLTSLIFSLTKIPSHLILLTAPNLLHQDSVLKSDSGLYPSITLRLRLRGGKGGFGSLLRGAATKAGQKKTNNFDACRDMSGRRLRHVNAEKKLEEWRAEADDRNLQKSAEEFLKKKAKEVRKNSPVDVGKYLDKYREDSAKCMEEVEESVKQSYGLYKKRKMAAGAGASKRMKIWLGKGKVDESESEDDEDSDVEEDGKSVVIDGGNSSGSGVQSSSDGEASGGVSDLEESGVLAVEPELAGSEDSEEKCEVDPRLEAAEEVDEAGEVETRCFGPDMPAEVEDEAGEVEARCFGPDMPAEVEDEVQVGLINEKAVEAELVVEELVVQGSDVSGEPGPLDFDLYNSAADLEVLGMERLKEELQSRGLKCGGTLQERAARLFLLKTTPLEKLPKKLLAKSAVGGK